MNIGEKNMLLSMITYYRAFHHLEIYSTEKKIDWLFFLQSEQPLSLDILVKDEKHELIIYFSHWHDYNKVTLP